MTQSVMKQVEDMAIKENPKNTLFSLTINGDDNYSTTHDITEGVDNDHNDIAYDDGASGYITKNEDSANVT